MPCRKTSGTPWPPTVTPTLCPSSRVMTWWNSRTRVAVAGWGATDVSTTQSCCPSGRAKANPSDVGLVTVAQRGDEPHEWAFVDRRERNECRGRSKWGIIALTVDERCG